MYRFVVGHYKIGFVPERIILVRNIGHALEGVGLHVHKSKHIRREVGIFQQQLELTKVINNIAVAGYRLKYVEQVNERNIRGALFLPYAERFPAFL